MEAVLWPQLIDFLLAPEYTNAIPSVIKSLSQLAFKMRQDKALKMIEYTNFKYVHGPYVLFARLLVLAALPQAFDEGQHVLAFMQNFVPNINKHLSGTSPISSISNVKTVGVQNYEYFQGRFTF